VRKCIEKAWGDNSQSKPRPREPDQALVLCRDGDPSANRLGIYGVWPRRSKSVIFGQSDSFKSFAAIDMACSCATGRSWHGHDVKQFKVIYIANEGANAVGRKRIPAWMSYHDIPKEERANIYLLKTETILPDEVSRANLLAAIRAIVAPDEDFGIVIDVLRGTMTGSESDDECANAWTRAAEILIQEGAAILTVTHSPYSDDGRMRGHSHLWGNFDTRLQAEGDKEKLTTVLKVNRHKDHDSGGQWGFQLEVHEIEEYPGETSLVPRLDGDVKQSTGNREGLANRALMQAILDNPEGTQADWGEAIGRAKASVNDRLQRLRKLKLVGKIGGKWYVTPQGMKQLYA
jgi:AAA domain